jgi:hypothetical protein
MVDRTTYAPWKMLKASENVDDDYSIEVGWNCWFFDNLILFFAGFLLIK